MKGFLDLLALLVGTFFPCEVPRFFQSQGSRDPSRTTKNSNDDAKKGVVCVPHLVGGWTNPFEKYATVKIGNHEPPQIFGVKISKKSVSCHHRSVTWGLKKNFWNILGQEIVDILGATSWPSKDPFSWTLQRLPEFGNRWHLHDIYKKDRIPTYTVYVQDHMLRMIFMVKIYRINVGTVTVYMAKLSYFPKSRCSLIYRNFPYRKPPFGGNRSCEVAS